MTKLEATRKRYHIFKEDLRMGVVCETRATAYEFIEEKVLEDYPEANTLMMYIGINRRYRKNYTIVTVINAENVKLVTFKIVPETIYFKLTDALEADFKKEGE